MSPSRREGRLHYFEGEFVETPPDEPHDMTAVRQMLDKTGRSSEDFLENETTQERYAMAHYIAEGPNVRIAFKDVSGQSPLSEEVHEEAIQRFRAWAEEQGLTPEFVSYADLA